MTQPGSRPQRAWTGPVVAYWFFTLVVVYENAAGFVWWIANFEYPRELIRHLGYPAYFIDILGPAQLVIAVILISPGLPITKEWAYAGALTNYASAVVSHLRAGDGVNLFVVAAAVCAALTIASWALRPARRRTPASQLIGETTRGSWVSALVVLALMLVGATLELPLLARLATQLPL